MSYSVYTDEETYACLSWQIEPGDLPKIFLGATAGAYLLAGIEHSFEPIAIGLGIATVCAWYKSNL